MSLSFNLWVYSKTLADVHYHIRQVAACITMGAFRTPILRQRELIGGQQWYNSKVMVVMVSNRLAIVTTRPQFAIECLQCSNQYGVGHFGAKYGEEGGDRCKPNFNAIWETCGCHMQKKLCWYLLPFEHKALTWQRKKNWQTDLRTEW